MTPVSLILQDVEDPLHHAVDSPVGDPGLVIPAFSCFLDIFNIFTNKKKNNSVLDMP